MYNVTLTVKTINSWFYPRALPQSRNVSIILTHGNRNIKQTLSSKAMIKTTYHIIFVNDRSHHCSSRINTEVHRIWSDNDLKYYF